MPFNAPVLLSTAYLAPVAYYAAIYAASEVREERCEHYVKQTYRNRCIIAGANGPQSLTLPVVRKGNNQPIAGVELSTHGDWQHLHWNAFVSAYENSPYFEYYADEFRPLYEAPPRLLTDFNAALRDVVLDLLGLTPRIVPTTGYAAAPDGVIDLRTRISPKSRAPLPCASYYQVFAARHGFLPGLSIADLLFNMGPESRLVLRRTAEMMEQAFSDPCNDTELPNIQIRQEAEHDRDAVEYIVRQAFREVKESDHTEHLLVARLRKSGAFVPELSLVAEADGKVVGHILLTEAKIKGKDTETTVLAVAPVSVAPEFRRKGIGGKLLRAAHEKAAALGYRGAVLLGHAAYYPQFGYRRASQFGITFPFDAPDDCCMAIELQENGLKGAEGSVCYPEAFGI